MKVLVKTGDLTREEWLKWRTKGIGGSDVSVIAGINRFRSVFQLWLEKTEQAEPEAGTVGGRKVIWKQVTSTGFDKKRLEKENKAVYDAYVTKHQYRRLQVA